MALTSAEPGTINSNDQTVFLTPPFPPAAFRVGDLSGSGVFGGIQFGYNWQSGNCCYVFGIEADFGGMDNSNNNHIQTQLNGPGIETAFRVRGSGGLYGDITGRLGYIWGESLFYAKGGFAWWAPSLEARETLLVGGDVAFQADHHETDHSLTGWTLGVGVEYMFTPSWTFKLEYLHFDFGSGSDSNCCGDGLNNIHLFGSDITVDTVKVGFNYMIHPPIAALK